MKKGQILEGVVNRYTFPNKGYVTITEERNIPNTKHLDDNGEAVFDTELVERTICIKGALLGQRVRFSLKKMRQKGGEGRLLEVLEPSGLEDQIPMCPHFGLCGGCIYQTLSYHNQLKIKEEQVKALLDEVMVSPYLWEGIKGSPVRTAYRNKMEFSFGDEYKDGPLALGMHKKGSFYDVVTVDKCKIVDGDYNKILKTVLDFYKEKKIPYYKKMQHMGSLRHLVIRQTVVHKDILVNLVTTSQTENCPKSIFNEDYKLIKEYLCLDELKERLLSLSLNGKIVGILHTLNDSLSDAVIPEKIENIFGQDYIYEEILGLKFKISPFSFFQTNSKGAELLYETARSYIGDTKNKIIFDLYSGTGTIAQMLAPVAKKVIGVEIVEEAVEAAKENATLNNLANCEFIAGDVLKVIDDIEDKPDIIVLDPPRDGLNPKALNKIVAYGVNEMIYISCKPTSLVRDLILLQEKGYKVVKCCAVDQFPGTVHVETVVLLSQQKPDDYVEVELELDGLDLTSAESKATYKEIQEYVLKEHGLKVSNLYIAQVKRKCGIEVGENYNLPKSEDSRQPQCPVEKEKAIKDALEHFGMI